MVFSREIDEQKLNCVIDMETVQGKKRFSAGFSRATSV
jgi:hypothetical protein